jgi:two-component system, NtrC family, nitrogen regulation sensor histidine kinase NtrY
MDFSRFHARIVLQVIALVVTLAALTWMIGYTRWYVTIILAVGIALLQVLHLIRFASRSGQEVTRFLDAVAFDDPATSFAGLSTDTTFAALGAAMTRVLEQLRAGRAKQQEQAQYLQTLIAHVPVALISVDERNRVELLNVAARRLFEHGCSDAAEFTRYGSAFSAKLDSLKPGEGAIVRMERGGGGPLQLKVAATGVTLSGVRRRLMSLQNIETELTAHELAAWQTVIRVMAHEVMNSLTPISSLAGSARGLVTDVLAGLPAEDSRRASLADVSEALEAVARRSEGLLHFLENHRRLTRRLEAKIEVVSLTRVFARLQRLLAGELATRNVEFCVSVEPETLTVGADTELLDQALINLTRNAMDALRDEPAARISLSAHQEPGAHVVITVADNGPGIPAEQREKVFVPFFTTKRQGSGVGLTLVRQIATVHGATVNISDSPGGGARVRIRF